MRIANVHQSGLERLVETYRRTRSMEDKMTFRSKSNSFFENMSISLKLCNVKPIELIYLRKFCGKLIFLGGENAFEKEPVVMGKECLVVPKIRTEEFSKRDEFLNDTIATVEGNRKYLLTKYPELLEDGKMNKSMPIGSIRFDIMAIFEGINILAILDAFPEYTLVDPKTKDYYDLESKAFVNFIASSFVEKFYSYIKSDLVQKDIVTDVRFDEEFLSHVDINNPITLTHIKTPYNEINWFKCESFNDLSYMVSDLKVKIKKDAMDSFYHKEDLTCYYALSTSMNTFLKFLLIPNLVFYHTDLKVLVGTNSTIKYPESIPDDGTEIDSNLFLIKGIFSDNVKALDKFRLDALSEIKKYNESKNKETSTSLFCPYVETELYNFIPRSSNIKFMIRGTIEEINSALEKLKDIFDKDEMEIVEYIDKQGIILNHIFQ